MILIDNYDSFTYNIVQYLEALGVSPKVFKNDEISVSELKEFDFDSIIISPGPGNPQDDNWCGISTQVVAEFYKTKKILGICLGHQIIANYFGARVIRDSEPCHGKISKIKILSSMKLFDGIPDGFEATRYHSLKVAKLPKCLIPLARTEDGVLMALKHRQYNIFGVQFHPEAILTQYGYELLSNFINL